MCSQLIMILLKKGPVAFGSKCADQKLRLHGTGTDGAQPIIIATFRSHKALVRRPVPG
jgi:hypothetical protein